MGDTPPVIKASSTLSYIVAALIMFLIAVILIGVILYLRPAYDPLVVISGVGAFMTAFMGIIATFIKSQETHLTVNSQLTAWKAEFKELQQSEGRAQGTKTEQERIAEQLRVAALTAAERRVPAAIDNPISQAPVPLAIAPVKVEIVGAPAVDGHVPVATKEPKKP